MRHDAKQRRIQALTQGIQIFFKTNHRWIDLIGDPAGQFQAARGNRRLRQQRMVEATETHADNQHQRQADDLRKFATITGFIKRHQQTAGAFHDKGICAGAIAQLHKTVSDVLQIDAHTVMRGGDMRRERLSQKIRIEVSTQRGNLCALRQIRRSDQ